ncbi:hypothetical protein BW723_01985 [Polaribacter reichenbachii]|uniref:Cardiolipin synthase N-terminal domain-containing protein n=1 Tax=Polaribacter reichenbachii TaxID=996801 RepID=A0A1B8TW25_9FLAO|nr:hypothetical protein [Polaribacter reichenbachii]APZ45138.1 hypothetical protein BW723_01985 [Polaribacter reichenbachii]AUC19000.1 hypothetical protein BTO17_09985 [Polaribacter reichenbachii]OBY63843.1 hypothetical protein LPB301_13715 [Polaribacter reichenbachii]
MLYYIIIAFQAFCIFHVYKSRNETYWYFVIFFVPVIGSIVYLFMHILNGSNLRNLTDAVDTALNPTKKIKELEKRLSFSETYQNLIDLGDAHRDNKDFALAIPYYEKALEGNYKNNPHTLNKAVKCYFELKDYNKVKAYANKIDLDKSFRSSIYIYAISLEKCGDFEEAEHQFRKIDKRYSNYPERLELSKFLIRREKKNDAKIVLDEIITEINNMIEVNQRKYRYIYQESRKLLKET